MSADFPSSNPFRRKMGTATEPTESKPTTPHNLLPQQPLLDTANTEPVEASKHHTKTVKKVRLQTPPPLSPEDEPIPRIPPAPISRIEETPQAAFDPFENASSDVSDISEDAPASPEPVVSKYTGAPLNPFQKTLATMERTEEGSSTSAPQMSAKAPAAGRASLDVDAFKRLLMTGVSGVTSPAAPPPPAHLGHLNLSDGTSTEASSISRHSMFEPIQEMHAESPRTSHEISDVDDERRRTRSDSYTSTSDKKKPPPPHSRHGKLIKMELKDAAAAPSQESLYSTSGNTPQQRLGPSASSQSLRSVTDLNKPLPAAPSRASHESDRESIFDKESAGKTPEPASPPSPPASTRRKTPPIPPITRRHSALMADTKNSRTPTGRLSPNIEETSLNMQSQDAPTQQSNKPPPPPPTRRPASIRNSSYTSPLQSPPIYVSEPERPASKSSSAPIPPPSRMSSIRHSGRPPSVSSMDMSGTSKRASAAPPPPPPRHRANSRASVEAPATTPGSSRTSGEFFRRSIDSVRRGSVSSQATVEKEAAKTEGEPATASSVPNMPGVEVSDILADITKLQREVDALRGQYESRRTN